MSLIPYVFRTPTQTCNFVRYIWSKEDKNLRKLISLICAVMVIAAVFSAVFAVHADKADFEYKLTVTDGDGREVINPRNLAAGSQMVIEIELTRTDTKATSYETYGLEFRILSRGLEYNNDGVSFRSGTPVKLLQYSSGDSVGFAYYDMEQVGERIGNPILAGRWSYTVTDPGSVNITVPVALMYIVRDSESYEPIGNARLFLDPNGGEIKGTDVSGEYKSGTVVKLPDAVNNEYIFKGWSDGVQLYPAGSDYTVSGIVTLTAEWEGIVRNRQIIFNPNGGSITGIDPSKMYADGEKIIIPEATRKGYTLKGWRDGDKLYQPDDEYIVDNSKVFIAEWEEFTGTTTDTGEDEQGDKTNVLLILAIILGAILLVGLGWWLFIILWKRRWVKYSLVNGDISLDFKDKEHTVKVAVVLTDGDNKYALGTSGVVKAGNKLRFIKGNGNVVEVDKGKYKGMLIAANGKDYQKGIKCRIKVLDRKLKERTND